MAKVKTAAQKAGAETIASPVKTLSFGLLNDAPKDIKEKQLEAWKKSGLLEHNGVWDQKVAAKVALAHGVPSELRPELWKKFAGNALNVTPELFKIFHGHATDLVLPVITAEVDKSEEFEEVSLVEADDDVFDTASDSTITPEKVDKLNNSENRKMLGNEKSVCLISVDLPRTSSNTQLLNSDDNQSQATIKEKKMKMKEALEAYVCYRPDLGYVQGMSYLAQVFASIDQYEAYDVFLCMANVLNRECLRTFYSMNREQLDVYFSLFNLYFKEHNLPLYNHFKEIGIEVELFLLEWILTLFSQVLQANVCYKVWDCLLASGDSFLFRVSIAILQVLSPHLLRMSFEEAASWLTRANMEISLLLGEDALFTAIKNTKISKTKYRILLNEFKSKSK